MIERTTSYKVGDSLFATIELAQQHEIALLLEGAGLDLKQIEAVVGIMVKNREKMVNILTMKTTSRAKGRKANGATRKPRAQKPIGKTDQGSDCDVDLLK